MELWRILNGFKGNMEEFKRIYGFLMEIWRILRILWIFIGLWWSYGGI
jgi:hypothetical protein